MGRDDLFITVPSCFRCPISLDVMKSPVSLCTGVTYDRSSIERWLDSGNNTCPATMQVLHTKELVPNHTLQRLIQLWSESVRGRWNHTLLLQQQDQARELVKQIHNFNIAHQQQNQNYSESISKLISFANESDHNRKFLATVDDGFVPILVEFIANCTSHREEVLVLLELLLREYRDRDYITKLIIETKDRVVSSMLFVLKQGSLASRTATARVLEFVAVIDAESKIYLAEQNDVASELIRLVGCYESDLNAVQAALSTLICISTRKRIRARLVRLGAVKVLGKLLSNLNLTVVVSERALKLLETVSFCKEGRAEICGDGVCVSAVVKKMLKVSAMATEWAVTILWNLCCSPSSSGEKVGEVARNNGVVTKILLLMQSNCSPAVRHMAGDLLKIFRVNSNSCLSSYDTKTTHIMPF